VEWERATGDSTGDKKIWFYRIYRDGNVIGEADGDQSNFTDASAAKTNHDYKVSAVNYYFKESAP
jgi:hypothetical protein